MEALGAELGIEGLVPGGEMAGAGAADFVSALRVGPVDGRLALPVLEFGQSQVAEVFGVVTVLHGLFLNLQTHLLQGAGAFHRVLGRRLNAFNQPLVAVISGGVEKLFHIVMGGSGAKGGVGFRLGAVGVLVRHSPRAGTLRQPPEVVRSQLRKRLGVDAEIRKIHLTGDPDILQVRLARRQLPLTSSQNGCKAKKQEESEIPSLSHSPTLS